MFERARYLLLLPGLVGLTSACGVERPLDGYEDGRLTPLPDHAVWLGDRVLVDGGLSGTIGQQRDVEGPAVLRAEGGGSFASVELALETTTGAVMHLIDFDGGIDHRALVPGAHLTFEGGAAPEVEDELLVAPLACNGPEVGTWELDAVIERVELDVTEGPWEGSRTFTWTLWQAEDVELGVPAATSVGSFTLAEPAALGLR